MGRAARKSTASGTAMRSLPRIEDLQSKYFTEGMLSEEEWLDLQSLQHGIILEEMPPVFRETLRELPASTREKALQKLSQDTDSVAVGRAEEAGEILSLIRDSINSEQPQFDIESDSGLRVILDSEYRLHNSEGPAVVWPNGTEGYYENGKEVRDGRPCRIYPNGTREYWDSYDKDLEMNVYKSIQEDGTMEWSIETGKVIRSVHPDGSEKIFPSGTANIPLVSDPYAWAGKKFHGNELAYREQRDQAEELAKALTGENLRLDPKDLLAIRELKARRHPFSLKSPNPSQEVIEVIRDKLDSNPGFYISRRQ